MKTFIYIGLVVGSVLGSRIPLIWGSSSFSFSGIILSVVFAVIGAILGQKIYQYFN